jgi:hypothetical protein
LDKPLLNQKSLAVVQILTSQLTYESREGCICWAGHQHDLFD